MATEVQTTALETIKASALIEATSISNSNYVVITDGSVSKKAKATLFKGDTGVNGKSIELQKTSTHIQWRQEGGEWTNLVALSDITGPAGSDVDLSSYATQSWVLEQIANVSGGGSVDLSSYALKSELHNHSNKAELNKIVEGDKAKWDAKSDFSGSYNDLTDKPNSLPANGGNADTVDGKHFVVLTQAEYDALQEKDPNTFYAISDASKGSGLTQEQSNKLNSIGDVANLTTTNKSNLVAAVNENKSSLEDIKTEWLGGKKNRYLTQAEYNTLSDLEKNDETIIYYITDKEEKVGITVEQSNQLETAYQHSQSKHFSGSYNDLLDKPLIGGNGILTSENGNKFIIKVSNEGVLSAEQIIEYGNIIINKTEISINENSNSSFTIKLDKAPTNNQTVNISVNNENCNVEPNLITFTNSNYNIEQTINVSGVYDSASFENKNSVISVSSAINNKTINITINNVDSNTQENTISFNTNDFHLSCNGVEIPPQNDYFIITQTESKYYFIKLINKEKFAYFKPNNKYNAVYDVLENTITNNWEDSTASHISALNTVYTKPDFDGTHNVTGVQKVPMNGISDETLFNERLNNQALDTTLYYLIRLHCIGSGKLKFKLDFEERL